MKAILTLVVLVILITGSINISMAATLSHPLLTTWGTSGYSNGSFYNPQNLAIDSNGNVYVTDLGNKRVQKFDSDGTFLNAWGSGGTGAGQFNSPIGIAIGENHVFVVDSQLNKIQKFDTDGNFVTQWGKQGDGPGEFLLPNGITINNNGTVLVVDTGNYRIQQFTSDGEFLREFGQSGTADDHFISPIGITTDSEKNIYVSDPGANKIKKFDSFGNFITFFGTNFAGSPLRALGLQIDPEGNLYVADSYNNRVLRLASDGLTLSVIGSMGIQAGQFKIPKDVALDQYANLYVVDSNGHRIQKFGTPIVSDTTTTSNEIIETESETNTSTSDITPVPGDLTKPVIIPPNDLVIEATGGLTPISVGQAMAMDASGIKSLTSNAPAEFSLGITTLIWTAIDGAGNMAIATQIVTVIDTTPPIISSLTDVIAEASSPTQNKLELEPPSATDSVGLMSITNDAPDVFPIGETIVTWTAADVVGNKASTSQTVIVVDSTDPTLHVPENVIFEATTFDKNEVFLGVPTVIDNGEILSISNDAPKFFGIGNTTVTWVAADASGNTAMEQQLVSVIDTTPPEVIPPENVIFEATSTTDNVISIGILNVTDVQNVTITNDAPDVFPIGETIVTWTAVDLDGNSALASQQISVVDTTPPTVIVPSDVTVEALGLDNNVVNLGEIIIEDVFGISSITNDAPEKFLFGNTTVIWTATDNYGNLASAEQIVSIIDTTPPQINAPKDITIEAIHNEENFVDLGQPMVEDLVDLESMGNDAPLSFPIGMTTVTWTASDTSGNTNSATQIINVMDTTIPEITIPLDIVAEATDPQATIVILGEATAFDTIGVKSITNDAPHIFPIGDTVVNWTATDIHGNVVTDSQIISVVDTIEPNIESPADILVEATDSSSNIVEIGAANASDIVGVVSIENNSPELFQIGDTIVTWTATDAAGNSAVATQTVSVVDTTPPVLTAPNSILIEASSEKQNIIELEQAVVQDLVGVLSITNDAPEYYPVGDTIVTWTATDAAGNSAVATQTVSVVDTTPPSLYLPSTKTVEATSQFDNYVEYGVTTASDQVGVTSLSNDAPQTFPLGLTSITWTVQDAAGNEKSGIQQVFVIDTTAPSITPPPDLVIEADSFDNNVVNIGEVQAIDAVGIKSITNNAPLAFPLGETKITWISTDSSENVASANQTITLIDTAPPTIVADENVIVEATSASNNKISLVPPIATDTVSSVAITNDAPNVFGLGQTLVSWTATDAEGNSETDSQLVTVVDTTSPTISIPEDVTVEAKSSDNNIIFLGNATAKDIVGIESIMNNGSSAYPYGQTIVTWTAIDTSGNTASDTQIVNVVDTTPPTIILPKDVILEATSISGNLVNFGNALSEDTIQVASLTNDAPNSFPLGDTIVTWIATDQVSNTASANQKITVVDTSAPELTAPTDVIIDASSLQTQVAIGQATSSDLIDPSPSITNDAPNTFQLGQTIVTWTTVDMFGNSVNATQIVEVQACGKPISYYNLIEASPEDDVIVGTNLGDLIFALGGDDIVIGEKGNDCIFGGEGDDIIFGNEGNDNITGDEGNDIIKGQSGDDIITGSAGIDIIDGGDDIDSCNISVDLDNDLIIKCEL